MLIPPFSLPFCPLTYWTVSVLRAARQLTCSHVGYAFHPFACFACTATRYLGVPVPFLPILPLTYEYYRYRYLFKGKNINIISMSREGEGDNLDVRPNMHQETGPRDFLKLENVNAHLCKVVYYRYRYHEQKLNFFYENCESGHIHETLLLHCSGVSCAQI